MAWRCLELWVGNFASIGFDYDRVPEGRFGSYESGLIRIIGCGGGFGFLLFFLIVYSGPKQISQSEWSMYYVVGGTVLSLIIWIIMKLVQLYRFKKQPSKQIG